MWAVRGGGGSGGGVHVLPTHDVPVLDLVSVPAGGLQARRLQVRPAALCNASSKPPSVGCHTSQAKYSSVRGILVYTVKIEA